jgi:transcriptional regulator of acetoin/glycerol metabolism
VDGYPPPQLHTHVVVFNMTKAEDKMRSPDPRELFRVQSMSTAIYRAELARNLRDLGYEPEHRDGHAFEIKGYTQEYLEADSARSKQIKQKLQELGVTGAEAAERVAHRTRDRKLHLSAEQTRALHRAVAAEFGNQADQSIEIVRKGKVLRSNDQVLAVQGGAGTGKSTALQAIRELAEERGCVVHGLAPTLQSRAGTGNRGHSGGNAIEASHARVQPSCPASAVFSG